MARPIASRKIALVLPSLALLAATTIFPAAARAADSHIAVVDVQRALMESKAGQALTKQLSAQQKVMQDDMAKQQAALQATQQSLIADAGKGDDSARKKS